MATYHLNIKTFSRATGSNATAAAAYRAGERLRDERNGRTYNFSRRQDVLHKEVVLPSKFDGAPMAWARDRASLWNAAERAGKRVDSRLAREFQVSLPHELGHGRHVELVREFSRELAERYGAAIDATIHAPRRLNDPRNFHAHLLATTRQVTEHGLGALTHLDISNRERAARGLESSSQEFFAVRKLWADLTNKALEQANVAARVDHRSLKARGVDRASQYVKPTVYRQLMKERAAARQSAAESKQTATEQVTTRPDTAGHRAAPKTLEEIRREAQARWYQMRNPSLRQDKSTGRDQPQSEAQPARRSRGKDFGL